MVANITRQLQRVIYKHMHQQTQPNAPNMLGATMLNFVGQQYWVCFYGPLEKTSRSWEDFLHGDDFCQRESWIGKWLLSWNVSFSSKDLSFFLFSHFPRQATMFACKKSGRLAEYLYSRNRFSCIGPTCWISIGRWLDTRLYAPIYSSYSSARQISTCKSPFRASFPVSDAFSFTIFTKPCRKLSFGKSVNKTCLPFHWLTTCSYTCDKKKNSSWTSFESISAVYYIPGSCRLMIPFQGKPLPVRETLSNCPLHLGFLLTAPGAYNL